MTRDQYLVCNHCSGHGAFSNDGNDPYGRSYPCEVCGGDGERYNAGPHWDRGLAIYIKAYAQAEGDREERHEIAYDALAAFDAELADAMCEGDAVLFGEVG